MSGRSASPQSRQSTEKKGSEEAFSPRQSRQHTENKPVTRIYENWKIARQNVLSGIRFRIFVGLMHRGYNKKGTRPAAGAGRGDLGLQFPAELPTDSKFQIQEGKEILNGE
jgi:hypothetical protein